MGLAAVNVAPWRCKTCGAELGRILDGVLRIEGRIVTVDRWGMLAVKCQCGTPRFWRPERCAKMPAATT